MMLKNNLCYYVIGVLAMILCGCETTRSIDENYLIINDIAIVSQDDNPNVLTLKIQGDYAECAWGIKEINHEIIKNTIVLTGTLVSEGKGAFEYSVNVPPDVDIVKINDRILWTRPEAM